MEFGTQEDDAGRRATARERGAVLVEFGLIAILLFTLLFGVIEFGSHFNDQQSVRQGTREAARSAVVNRYTGSCASGTPTANLICTVKREVGLRSANTYVAVRVTAGTSTSDRGLIRVCTQYRASSLTGFFPFLNNLYLTTRVEMRNEIGTTPAVTTTEEALPSGRNWNFCSA